MGDTAVKFIYHYGGEWTVKRDYYTVAGRKGAMPKYVRTYQIPEGASPGRARHAAKVIDGRAVGQRPKGEKDMY